MNNFTFDDFKKASNKNLYNNDIFNIRNKNTKIVVEGPDDICFYKSYLQNIYEIIDNDSIICVINGKKDVIKLAKINKKKTYKYIVDLDYDNKEKLISSGAIVTSGYSMENFFFYFNMNNNNLHELIYHLCKDYGYVPGADKLLIKMVETNLVKYKENHLLYYAYMKSLIECRKNNSLEMKEASFDEYINIIEQELADLSDYERNKMLQRINNNKSIINDAEYMLIRGHDLFDYLLYLLKNNPYIETSKITKKYLYSLAEYLFIPDDFKEQLN